MPTENGQHRKSPDDFERFKRLTKGLLAVPKKELDRKLARKKRKKLKRQP